MADIYSIKDPAQANVEHNMFCIGQGYGTCNTSSTASGARVVTLVGYKVVKGFVAVRFLYDVPAGATMNINQTTAYPIRMNSASIGAGVINSGYIVVFYFDGSYYNVVSIYDNGALIENLTTDLYDWYYVSSPSSVITEGNTSYLLISGQSGVIMYDSLVNGLSITIYFGLREGVEGLIQAGLTEFNIKFEDSTETMLCISDVSLDPLPMTDFLGAKSVTARYNAADSVFFVESIVYDVTDTATSGSHALMTSGGVYDILGDIESLLAAI